MGGGCNSKPVKDQSTQNKNYDRVVQELKNLNNKNYDSKPNNNTNNYKK